MFSKETPYTISSNIIAFIRVTSNALTVQRYIEFHTQLWCLFSFSSQHYTWEKQCFYRIMTILYFYTQHSRLLIIENLIRSKEYSEKLSWDDLRCVHLSDNIVDDIFQKQTIAITIYTPYRLLKLSSLAADIFHTSKFYSIASVHRR